MIEQSKPIKRIFLSALAACASDRRGVIAVWFAVLLTPLIVVSGAGLDYSSAITRKAQMQQALDSAVIAGTVAVRDALNGNSTTSAAISAGNAAAATYYKTAFYTGGAYNLTTKFTVSGVTVAGFGSATSTIQTNFMALIGISSLNVAVTSQSTTQAAPYLDVYLLIDISASMLLPSTQAGIASMISGQSCALACHNTSDGTDSYSWALKQGIQLRYQVVNQGILNLLNYLNSYAIYQSRVRVSLWALDASLTQLSALTSNFPSVANKFPAPAIASTNASAATPFNTLVPNFVSAVGSAGNGSSWSSPKKLVILASDGVNDPTRAWTSNVALRAQVKVFDTTFCSQLQSAGVTVAILNTPYYPMTWDWGYNATLGQPGSLGGATRVDDIPIALQACAGANFIRTSDVATIESAFTTLFVQTSPVALTK